MLLSAHLPPLGVQDPKNSPEGWRNSKTSSMTAQAELRLGWLRG